MEILTDQLLIMAKSYYSLKVANSITFSSQSINWSFSVKSTLKQQQYLLQKKNRKQFPLEGPPQPCNHFTYTKPSKRASRLILNPKEKVLVSKFVVWYLVDVFQSIELVSPNLTRSRYIMPLRHDTFVLYILLQETQTNFRYLQTNFSLRLRSNRRLKLVYKTAGRRTDEWPTEFSRYG